MDIVTAALLVAAATLIVALAVAVPYAALTLAAEAKQRREPRH